MIAIIQTGGKQYNVKKGDVLNVEKLDAEIGAKVKFNTLLISDTEGKNLQLGAPSLGEPVEAKIVEHGKSEKVTIIKFKNKVRYRRKAGHRQPFTKVEIVKV